MTQPETNGPQEVPSAFNPDSLEDQIKGYLNAPAHDTPDGLDENLRPSEEEQEARDSLDEFLAYHGDASSQVVEMYQRLTTATTQLAENDAVIARLRHIEAMANDVVKSAREERAENYNISSSLVCVEHSDIRDLEQALAAHQPTAEKSFAADLLSRQKPMPEWAEDALEKVLDARPTQPAVSEAEKAELTAAGYSVWEYEVNKWIGGFPNGDSTDSCATEAEAWLDCRNHFEASKKARPTWIDKSEGHSYWNGYNINWIGKWYAGNGGLDLGLFESRDEAKRACENHYQFQNQKATKADY